MGLYEHMVPEIVWLMILVFTNIAIANSGCPFFDKPVYSV